MKRLLAISALLALSTAASAQEGKNFIKVDNETQCKVVPCTKPGKTICVAKGGASDENIDVFMKNENLQCNPGVYYVLGVVTPGAFHQQWYKVGTQGQRTLFNVLLI